MRVRLTTDLLTGLFFVGLGGFVILYGSRYPMGTAMRMGPGYFPFLVSSGLVLLGLILVFGSLVRGGETVGTLALRPLFFVLVATLAFGFLIERAGFVVAGITLVLASRCAEGGFRFGEVAGLAVFLSLLIAGIFRYGLGLPIPLLPF